MQTPDAYVIAQALVMRLAETLRARCIETHISWVLIAGELVYKIKKPVSLPFVNYSSLDARRRFCEEEVRLNGRLAPSLYLGVTRITGSCSAPVLDGPGPALEYAVRMHRFPVGALFSERLEAGTLLAHDIDQLALLLSAFHTDAACAAPDSGFAGKERRAAAAFTALAGAFPADRQDAQPRLQLQTWLQAESAKLGPLWDTRLREGHVRECHGDLHLGNIYRHGEAVAAFDGIEFDPTLRWIDVIDDIAFPFMDLAARGRPDFAFRLLNHWLDATGDHHGLPALRFSVIYRALVRCEVAQLGGVGHRSAADRYLAAALGWMNPSRPHLWITHGLPGSGKTYESQLVLEQEGAIRVRSDVERKRLFEIGMLEDSRAKGLDLYTDEVTSRTYARLFAIAGQALRAGYSVVLDAAFLRRSERARARELATDFGVPFSIIHCDAPLPVLRDRLAQRSGDASEAGLEVLDQMRAIAEPLDPDERRLVAAAATRP